MAYELENEEIRLKEEGAAKRQIDEVIAARIGILQDVEKIDNIKETAKSELLAQSNEEISTEDLITKVAEGDQEKRN